MTTDLIMRVNVRTTTTYEMSPHVVRGPCTVCGEFVGAPHGSGCLTPLLPIVPLESTGLNGTLVTCSQSVGAPNSAGLLGWHKGMHPVWDLVTETMYFRHRIPV